MAAQSARGGLCLQAFELREDLLQDGADQGIVGIQSLGNLLYQVVSLHLALFVGMQNLAEGFHLFYGERTSQKGVNLRNPLIRDANIRPGEACQIKAPVQYSEGFRSELTVNVLGLDHHRVHSLTETQPNVSLPELLNGIEDGMSSPIRIAISGIFLIQGGLAKVFPPLLPGLVEIHLSGLFNLTRIKFHALDSRKLEIRIFICFRL